MARMDHGRTSELVRKARERDESALSELVRMYEQRLLQAVRSELGDRLRQRLESQDVMQQVYLDALRSIDQFVDRGDDSFFAWLRRIALNRICDADRKELRTLKRAGEVRASDLAGDASLDLLLDALTGGVSTPSRVVSRAEQGRLLRAALEELSEDQQRVIELRYLKQLNVAETAEKMDRSERAVRSVCARALICLRELLGDGI
ncbi:MAG: sigma-70 family RNA polymerase sigma factor [Phycisphaerae bacterium]|nr:sigma-70 family RNA polymerase sigma factor [Phycisphaerae bacterium]